MKEDRFWVKCASPTPTVGLQTLGRASSGVRLLSLYKEGTHVAGVCTGDFYINMKCCHRREKQLRKPVSALGGGGRGRLVLSGEVHERRFGDLRGHLRLPLI